MNILNQKQCQCRILIHMYALILVCFLSGCISRVDIPVIDHFSIKTRAQSGAIDVEVHKKQLLSDMYILMEANKGTKVPICIASKKSKQCIDNGVSFFVWGGIIPGFGAREYLGIIEISQTGNEVGFTKDNSDTTFIYTPMYVRDNVCRIFVRNGGIQVEMDRYYANWAGVGNMTMAEGWAIDYVDIEKGIIGLQLELDISGPFTIGGGSKYVLLKFPNVPETLSQSKYKLLKKDVGE